MLHLVPVSAYGAEHPSSSFLRRHLFPTQLPVRSMGTVTVKPILGEEEEEEEEEEGATTSWRNAGFLFSFKILEISTGVVCGFVINALLANVLDWFMFTSLCSQLKKNQGCIFFLFCRGYFWPTVKEKKIFQIYPALAPVVEEEDLVDDLTFKRKRRRRRRRKRAISVSVVAVVEKLPVNFREFNSGKEGERETEINAIYLTDFLCQKGRLRGSLSDGYRKEEEEEVEEVEEEEEEEEEEKEEKQKHY